jgi:hypothetical protein
MRRNATSATDHGFTVKLLWLASVPPGIATSTRPVYGKWRFVSGRRRNLTHGVIDRPCVEVRNAPQCHLSKGN